MRLVVFSLEDNFVCALFIEGATAKHKLIFDGNNGAGIPTLISSWLVAGLPPTSVT